MTNADQLSGNAFIYGRAIHYVSPVSERFWRWTVVSDLQGGHRACGGWLVDVCDALADPPVNLLKSCGKIIDKEDNLLDQQIPPRGFLALLRKR